MVFPYSQGLCELDQRSKFFVSGQTVGISGFVNHMTSVLLFSSGCHVKTAINNTQIAHDCGYVSITLYYNTET